MYRLFAILLLVIVTRPAEGQGSYLFTHLGTRQGLLSNDVNSVQQDRKGFIWIASSNGIQRYDGNRFISIAPGGPGRSTMPDEKVAWLRIDPMTNQIWILFDYNKIGYLNADDFSFHLIPVRAEREVIERSYGRLFIDYRSNVMLMLSGDDTYTYDPLAHEFSSKRTPFTLPGWKPYWLWVDSAQESYWIGCNLGLVKYNVRHKTMSYRDHNTDRDPIIDAFADKKDLMFPTLDHSGRFWATTWPANSKLSVLCYDPKTQTIHDWEPEMTKAVRNVYFEIQSIWPQQDGTVWIGGLEMLAMLKPLEKQMNVISNNRPGEFSIRYDIVQHIFEDREHNVWFATNKGLFRCNPAAQMFRSISNRKYDKDSIYTPEVSDIFQTKDDNILVSTWGSGVFAYDSSAKPIKLDYINQAAKKGERLSWCIYQRPNGDIWRGNQDGYLYISNPGNKQLTVIRPPACGNSTIRQIVEDSSGNMWLGTHNGRLAKWNPDSNSFTLVQHFSTTIFRLIADSHNNIWVCTRDKGLYQVRVQDGLISGHYTSTGPVNSRLMAVGVNDIVQFNDSLYVIASAGLNLLNLNKGTISVINPRNGLPSNTVSNIIKDRDGMLWITSQNGLCNINMKNLVVTVFNESDGIESNSFGVGSINMLRDGRIAIGTAHDWTIFDPTAISKTDLTPPNVEITGIAVMNKWLPLDSINNLSNIELEHDENSMTINFSTLTYQNNFGIKYKLDGLDKEWIIANSRQAEYNYLPPGNYTFKILAENADNEFSNKTTELRITVSAAFWKTKWFVAFLFLLGAALLYWFDRERMKRKEAFLTMRTSISDNLHEEVNNALHNINVLSEIAKIKADKQPEQSKNYINEIHARSHDMIIAMDDMLWSLDPDNDNMNKTINRFREFADALRNRYEVNIDLLTDEKVKLLNPDMTVRHELMLIFKLALRLLVEENRAPNTTVQIDYVKSHLHLNIFATGLHAANPGHKELKMIEEMKTRAALVNGSLELQSDDKGTAVIFIVRV